MLGLEPLDDRLDTSQSSVANRSVLKSAASAEHTIVVVRMDKRCLRAFLIGQRRGEWRRRLRFVPVDAIVVPVRALGNRFATVLVAVTSMAVVAADSAASMPIASTGPEANTVTFRDAVGEDALGPDITSVVVSADADRQLSFRVNLRNRPMLTEDMRMRIWLDADDNPNTGLTVEDKRGLDYFMLVDRWELGLGVARLFVCSGSTCSGSRQIGFSYSNGGTFSIDSADLRIERRQRLRFRVESSSGWVFDPVKGYDFTNVHYEAAPDQGYWTFDMRPLVVKGFTATPTRPHAGSRYVLRISAVRTATGKRVRGRVACSFTVGQRSLRPRTRAFFIGSAVCVFDIPLGAQGKKYRSSISIIAGTDRIDRSLKGTIS